MTVFKLKNKDKRSSLICGGPGAGNSDPQTVSYEVIVETCAPTVGTDDVFLNYPWLITLLDPSNCNNAFVTVYQLENVQYLTITNEPSQSVPFLFYKSIYSR